MRREPRLARELVVSDPERKRTEEKGGING